MAYIPPHKRHSKDSKRPSPTPEVLVPQFKRNFNLRSSKHNVGRSGKIVYADQAISRWLLAGIDDDNQFPCSVHLEPVSVELVGRRSEEKPLVLVNSNPANENDEVRENISRSPWESVAENVWPDLLSSFEIMRNKMECENLEEVKPSLVARFGKILFNGSPSCGLERVRKDKVAETTLRQLRRSFYTNVPSSYMKNIVSGVVPMIGSDHVDEKEIFHVKLSDSNRPDSTISCKCSVKEDKTLELFKVELNQVRQMVVDVSCVHKNLDLRLMLCSKRILTALTDDEMPSIRNLINSAVLDPEVKGGLRWPLGKSDSGDGYSVVGVWHTTAKSYKGPLSRLKVRHADRFDFGAGVGETAIEVVLKLKRILYDLQVNAVWLFTYVLKPFFISYILLFFLMHPFSCGNLLLKLKSVAVSVTNFNESFSTIWLQIEFRLQDFFYGIASLSRIFVC
ncbi:hypothetical protein Ddye_027924 [Dipteronia dyeriana]|uniref:DUF7903 domain-containing protein n=1 Tax=Dipteronia dyeriana TaxID=168575 RepID=A0AAD9TQZ3_9ROSI|nr:hypothetical protein Ddye_027924 [Dipteronia dyeriana]